MLIPLLLVCVAHFLQDKFVKDHRESDWEETDQEGVGEYLIFVDSGALSAVVDEFVVGFREGYDERVESEENRGRRQEEVRIFGPVVARMREQQVESEREGDSSKLKQEHQFAIL